MGLGAETARQLAGRGVSTIVLTARSLDRLEKLAAELEAAHETHAHVIQADLAEPGGAASVVAEVESLGLDIDVLINNAGFGKWGRFEQREIGIYREMIDLNVSSLVELCHRLGAPMLERGRGAILNVGSLAGFVTLPYVGVYAATKAFVLSFSEALWAEWRSRGVTVTCLCPGGTESGFHETSESYHHGSRRYMPADVVVRAGLEGLLAGKATVFASFTHLAVSRAPALMSRGHAARIMARKLRPPE